jgi:PIN domain nuclease of toxin-antitoxin system
LSQTANHFIETHIQQGGQVAIASITLAEMVYLIEKGKVPAESTTLVATELSIADGTLVEIPFDLKVARALSFIASSQVPDMPDRIIAATAYHLHVPLISRDGKIQ